MPDKRSEELPITPGAAKRIDDLGRNLRRYIDRKFRRVQYAIFILGATTALALYIGYSNGRHLDREVGHRSATARAERRALCEQQTRGTAALRSLIILATVAPKPGSPQARQDDPAARVKFRNDALTLVGGPRPPCLAAFPDLTKLLEREHVLTR